MESADEDKKEPGAVLATTADASDNCEETTPAVKLLFFEREGGLLRRQLTPITKPESLTRRRKIC